MPAICSVTCGVRCWRSSRAQAATPGEGFERLGAGHEHARVDDVLEVLRRAVDHHEAVVRRVEVEGVASDVEDEVVLGLLADRVGEGDEGRAHAALALHVEHVEVAGLVGAEVEVGLAEAEHADDVEQHLADQRRVVVGVDAVVRAQRVRQLLDAPGRQHRRDQADEGADVGVLVGVEHVLAQHVLGQALLDLAELGLRVAAVERGLLLVGLLEEDQAAGDAEGLVELAARQVDVEEAVVAGVARGSRRRRVKWVRVRCSVNSRGSLRTNIS